MIFTGLYGFLFMAVVVALLWAFFRWYIVPNGLKGKNPDSLAVALDRKRIAAMPAIDVKHILVIGK